MEAIAPLRIVGGNDVVNINPEPKLRIISTNFDDPTMYPPMFPKALPVKQNNVQSTEITCFNCIENEAPTLSGIQGQQ
jgi:hypothetical protein